MGTRRLFTSESVTEGHPDKICDQISDAVLDEILTQDPLARVACETSVTTGLVLVAGEITTTCYVDIPKIVRRTITEIGYTRAKYGFDAETCAVITSIDEQSPDIAQGVDSALEARDTATDAEIEEIGAGDQGPCSALPATRRPSSCRFHLARAQARAAPQRRSQKRRAPLPAAGRQDASDHRVRRRHTGAGGHDRHLHAARREHNARNRRERP